MVVCAPNIDQEIKSRRNLSRWYAMSEAKYILLLLRTTRSFSSPWLKAKPLCAVLIKQRSRFQFTQYLLHRTRS